MKAVLFDFDGTIADTFPLFVALIEKYSKKLNLDLSAWPDLEKNIKEFSMRDLFKEFQISIFKLIRYGRKFQYEIRDQVENIKPFPGINELIRDLHNSGILVGIVTVNMRTTVEGFLAKQELSDFVDFVISDRWPLSKRRSLKKAIKTYGLDLNNTIYVGDDVNDIISSTKVGIKCVCVSWGYNSKKLLQKNNVFVVDNAEMLHTYLNKELI